MIFQESKSLKGIGRILKKLDFSQPPNFNWLLDITLVLIIFGIGTP